MAKLKKFSDNILVSAKDADDVNDEVGADNGESSGQATNGNDAQPAGDNTKKRKWAGKPTLMPEEKKREQKNRKQQCRPTKCEYTTTK